MGLIKDLAKLIEKDVARVFDNSRNWGPSYLHGSAEGSSWKIYRHGIIALLKTPIQMFDSLHL